MGKFIKYKDLILLTIGTMLVILSFCLLIYDKFELVKDNVFNDIELEKYKENIKNDVQNNPSNDENINNDNNDNNLVDDNNLELDDVTEEKEIKESTKKKIQKEYIGYLEIEKLNLKQGLVSKNSRYNNVNYNIQLLSSSDYPDKEGGNTILAAHSGTSHISYFKNLYKLSVGEEARIYYKGYVYTYKIVDIYNVPKVGSIEIKRDINKTCLTLITCTKNSKTEQTVYILELVNKEVQQ